MKNGSYWESQGHERRCSILRRTKLESSFENMFRDWERRVSKWKRNKNGRKIQQCAGKKEIRREKWKDKAVADWERTSGGKMKIYLKSSNIWVWKIKEGKSKTWETKEGKRQKIIPWINNGRRREIIIYDGLSRNSHSKGKGNEECKIERFERREKRYEAIIIYSPP